MIGMIFSILVGIIVGIFELIIGLIGLIIRFLWVIVKFLLKIIIGAFKFIIGIFKGIISGIGNFFSFIFKTIISLFKMIISGIGKILSFIAKPFTASWKFIASFFGKSGAAVSSVVKAPIVAKSIATAVSGTTVAMSSGIGQSTKVIAPMVTQTTKGVAKVAKNTVELTTKSVRRITKLEKSFIKNAKLTKKSGKLVAQRNSTFNVKSKDALGRSNKERMEKGLAPIGKDGKSVELHHLKQKNDGTIVELTNKEHNLHSKTLHRYTKKSEINRQDFDKWKKQYWKDRAKEFE